MSVRLAEIVKAVPRNVCVFWTIAALVLCGASAALANWAPSAEASPWHPAIVAAISTFLGLFGFFFALWVTSADWMKRNLMPFYELLAWPHFGIALGVALLLCILCLPVSHKLDIAGALVNPAGLFALVTGWFTVVGVYVTLLSVLELRQTITSFPVLMERLCKMIDETKHDEGDFVRYFAYTPAIGSLALAPREWSLLKKKLEDHTTNIQMICPKKEDLAEFHAQFVHRVKGGTKAAEQEKVDKTSEEAENILTVLTMQAKDCPELMPVRLPASLFPGYYVFANKSRTIIVAPLYLPLPSQWFGPDDLSKLPNVQMLGFETTDSGVVHSVHLLCELYRSLDPRDGSLEGFGVSTDEFRVRIQDCLKAIDNANSKELMKVWYRVEVGKKK